VLLFVNAIVTAFGMKSTLPVGTGLPDRVQEPETTINTEAASNASKTDDLALKGEVLGS
jgi:hypothetical protein